MPSPQFFAGGLVFVGIVFAIIGAVQSGDCAFAHSLEFFGLAAILVGGGIAFLGALPVLPPAAILGVALVVIGWSSGSGSGCGFL